MIDDITIKNEASFDATGQMLSDLRKVNFFYGPNGSGKTTISRIIDNEEDFSDSIISWQSGIKTPTLVYNRDFVNKTFRPDIELKGIFTLGAHDANIIQKIEAYKLKLDEITAQISSRTDTLKGIDGNGGKTSELETLEKEFTEHCWLLKQKYDNDFKGAFTGVRDTKEKFKTRLTTECTTNTEDLLDLETLIEKAGTIFSGTQSEEDIIPPISFSELVGLENSEILTKKVIGKDDVDITAMIKKLGNSDWVQAGRAFYELNDDYCPFCQQKTDKAFALSLSEYFDETFLNDIASIDTLETKYNAVSDIIIKRLQSIIDAEPIFIDWIKLQTQKDIIDARIAANKQHISRKRKEPSLVIKLEPLEEVSKEIEDAISQANKKIQAHNVTMNNLTKEKRTLTAQIWQFIVNEVKPLYTAYASKKSGLIKAIDAITATISSSKGDYSDKLKEVEILEKTITSIKPTIDEINKLLSSFGFTSFSLAQSEKDGFYKILRPDGEEAKETLSEGEKTFITFLYFYHLLKGSNNESGTTEDRIVVFDDPISSLDSDILFIVSHLIKGLFNEVSNNEGYIKQIFILTHNIYFHKELSFNKKRSGDSPMNFESFWIIKKNQSHSVIERQETNPIKTSYDLLWGEIRVPNKSSLTIQNTMRRIIENYFKILGGINTDDLVSLFDGKDKIIVGSLMSWMNDGSHFTNDDLYISCDEQTIDKYLEVFRMIFEKTENISHYNMMMGISNSFEPSKATDIPKMVGA